MSYSGNRWKSDIRTGALKFPQQIEFAAYCRPKVSKGLHSSAVHFVESLAAEDPTNIALQQSWTSQQVIFIKTVKTYQAVKHSKLLESTEASGKSSLALTFSDANNSDSSYHGFALDQVWIWSASGGLPLCHSLIKPENLGAPVRSELHFLHFDSICCLIIPYEFRASIILSVLVLPAQPKHFPVRMLSQLRSRSVKELTPAPEGLSKQVSYRKWPNWTFSHCNITADRAAQRRQAVLLSTEIIYT